MDYARALKRAKTSMGKTNKPDFSQAEWGRYPYYELAELDALLHPEERKLMAWMANDAFTGQGEIVDAGAFLGGSAKCFAFGLNRNGNVSRKDSRIHSYDLFRKGDWLQPKIENWSALKTGESTLTLYHDQLAELDRMVTLYPGDITKRTWSGQPIEILMLDCSKTKELNDHCMRMFMPDMIPGESYLLHQDYAIRSALYWLHSTMHLLEDYFEHLVTVRFGGTTLFRLKKKITPAIIEDVIRRQDENPKAIMEAGVRYANKINDEKLKVAIETSYAHRPNKP